MDSYCAKIRKLEGKFYGIEYHHVVRDQNQLADHLSKIGSSRAMIPPGVYVQDLFTSSIKEEKEVQEIPPAEQLVLTVPSAGRRLEGIVHQVPHQRRRTRRQD